MKKMILALAVLGGVLMIQPALAHKVVMDLYVEAETIEGEVGFSNGDKAFDSKVDVLDEQGKALGAVMTDKEGMFVFKPTQKVTHVFRANLGAGHIVERKVLAEDLPEVLAGAEASVALEAKKSTVDSGTVNSDVLRKIVSKEVNRAVKPLRKDIIAMREQKEIHSILGGIGYIVGLFGLVFFVMGRRKSS